MTDGSSVTVASTVTELGSGEKFCTDKVKTCVSNEIGAERITVRGPLRDVEGCSNEDVLLVKKKFGTEGKLAPEKTTGKD